MIEQLSLSLVFGPCLLQEALHDPLPPPPNPLVLPHTALISLCDQASV